MHVRACVCVLAETGRPYANIITPIKPQRGLRRGFWVDRLAADVCDCWCVCQWVKWLQSWRSNVCVCVCVFMYISRCAHEWVLTFWEHCSSHPLLHPPSAPPSPHPPKPASPSFLLSSGSWWSSKEKLGRDSVYGGEMEEGTGTRRVYRWKGGWMIEPRSKSVATSHVVGRDKESSLDCVWPVSRIKDLMYQNARVTFFSVFLMSLCQVRTISLDPFNFPH